MRREASFFSVSQRKMCYVKGPRRNGVREIRNNFRTTNKFNFYQNKVRKTIDAHHLKINIILVFFKDNK